MRRTGSERRREMKTRWFLDNCMTTMGDRGDDSDKDGSPEDEVDRRREEHEENGENNSGNKRKTTLAA